MKNEIEKLHNLGLSYRKIAKQLGCCVSTVGYYLTPNEKEKNKERGKLKKKNQHPYKGKLSDYLKSVKLPKNRIPKSSSEQLICHKIQKFYMGDTMSEKFTLEDIINKFGEKPICYLTGEEIDIYQPRTYQFDHKIPRSRGGENSIENLGIVTKQANKSKTDMTPDEYFNLCKRVLEHQGYKIQGE